MRLVFGLSAAGAFAFGLLLPRVNPHDRGFVVLLCLAISGFLLSLFTGAYLTADAVSAEKRDGTLGLLFLTPLKGGQIVLGKMAVHSIQVSCALLSALPFFFLPQLLGGVAWVEVLRIWLALAVTLALSLSGGMFWSTLLTDGRRAVLATVISLSLLTLVPWLWPFLKSLLSRGGNPLSGVVIFSPVTQIVFAFDLPFRSRGPGMGSPLSGAMLYWTAIGFNLAMAVACITLSGWCLPAVWRRMEAGATGRTPLNSGQPFPRPKPRAPWWAPTPDRAPLLWLAARNLAQPPWLKPIRILALAFLAFMVVLSVTTRHWEAAFMAACGTAYALHALVRIQLALAATRWWNEDKRSRALEAILVTPVTDENLLSAHHQALRWTFLNPLLSLIGLNVLLQSIIMVFYRELHMGGGAWAVFTVFFLGGAVLTIADFAAMRWLALRESLRRATPLKAAGWVLGRLCAGAWIGFAVTFLIAIQYRRGEEAACVFACWILACLIYNAVLIHSCRAWLHPGIRWRLAE